VDSLLLISRKENPVSLWESFRKNVFEKRVRPVPGSVLRCDLAGGIKLLSGLAGSICHTGIYLGNDKIAEVSPVNGRARVRIVDPDEFLSGDSDSLNRTGAFIYVATDNTGEQIEYACFLANCFPGGINTDAFNYTSGEHNLVQTDIEFHCTKYESLQINKVAEKLLKKYRIVTNSLNFHSGIGTEAKDLGYGNAQDFNVQKGILEQTDNETLDEYKISYNEYGTNYNHGEPLMFNSYSGHTRLV
jgi:hypothetical protein